jgi:hypothetical protein
MKPTVKATIAYLDLLRENGLLEAAMLGQIPDHVLRAARLVAASRVPGVPFDKEKCTVPVTQEEQEEIQREIEAYLMHYGLAKPVEQLIREVIPREIRKGKYVVTRGTHAGRVVLIRGTDKEVFGLEWMENYGHPACESFLFRVERDRVPLNGRFYVGTFEGRDIILHENEIGDPVS